MNNRKFKSYFGQITETSQRIEKPALNLRHETCFVVCWKDIILFLKTKTIRLQVLSNYVKVCKINSR